MPELSRRLLTTLCICTLPVLVLAAPRSTSLKSWMDAELIPSVVEILSTHPRFQGEVIRFVIMKNGKPAPLTNALAVALRDHLQRALVARTHIRIAWQADQASFSRHSEQQRVDCTTSTVSYYIGLEINADESGQHTVSVRALDIGQQNWIAGIGGTWRGRLSSSQLRQFRKAESDQAYLGQRTVPFEDTQTDLLAAKLAHDLGCAILRQLSDEYIAKKSSNSEDVIHEMTDLVTNNLAAYRALQITEDSGSHNSVIESSAHLVDDDLYQYWITLTPTDAQSDLPSISASAYVYLPEKFLPASLAAAGQSAGLSNDTMLIDSLQIVRMHDNRACATADRRRIYSRQYGQRGDGCYALQTSTARDSVAFVLYHQLNNGLVRLSSRECAGRSEAHIVRKNQAMQFPLSIDEAAAPSWLPAGDWMIDPEADTYYVVASTNAKAARALGKHFERLPERCGKSLRPGLEGGDLRRWFRELDAIAAYWRSDIDWQSVRVRNVY